MATTFRNEKKHVAKKTKTENHYYKYGYILK